MKLYELNYLISANISEKETFSLNEEVQSLIKKEDGIIRKFIISPEKRLAYPIEGKTRAFLTTIVFDLSIEKINLIKKAVKNKKEIIRHLIFRKKDIKEEIKKEIREKKKKKRELVKIVKPEKEKKNKTELKEIEKKLEEILQE